MFNSAEDEVKYREHLNHFQIYCINKKLNSNQVTRRSCRCTVHPLDISQHVCFSSGVFLSHYAV